MYDRALTRMDSELPPELSILRLPYKPVKRDGKITCNPLTIRRQQKAVRTGDFGASGGTRHADDELAAAYAGMACLGSALTRQRQFRSARSVLSPALSALNRCHVPHPSPKKHRRITKKPTRRVARENGKTARRNHRRPLRLSIKLQASILWRKRTRLNCAGSCRAGHLPGRAPPWIARTRYSRLGATAAAP